MKYLLSVALLGLSVSVSAAPAVILEDTKGVPPGWSFHASASASDKITLFVALKEPGIAELKAKLAQRQNPADPSFGRHLTRDEVLQHRQPATTAAGAVSSWLKTNGVRDVHNQGSLLSFEATAQTVKSMLQADLAYYAYNGSDAAPVLRAQSYTIPAALRDYIDFVHPLTNFLPPHPRHGHRPQPPKPKPRPPPPKSKPSPPPGKPTNRPPKPADVSTTTRKTSTASSTQIGIPPGETPQPISVPCMGATVPSCIKQLYNISYTPPSTSPSPVRLGIAGFLEQWVQYTDVTNFLSRYIPSSPAAVQAANFTIEPLNNGTNPQSPPSAAGLEASLDVQYALALGHPAQITYYTTGGRGTKLSPATGQPVGGSGGGAVDDDRANDNEPYLEFLEAMLAKADDQLPHVLSVSYADDEASVPRAYALKVCDLFMALTARGVSVLVATGDGGAAGTGQSRCVVGGGLPGAASDAADDFSGLTKKYVPTFPASCPYVTAVGATDNVGPPLAGAVFSAGGFSDVFARPAWQDAVVAPYVAGLVAANDSRLALFNASGRATPDISAIGAGFQIILGGSTSQVLGTSASTPVVAAMVALVNDARLRAGKPSLGWLNPLLYAAKVRSVLKDVTAGDSAGCRFPDGTSAPGWTAVQGYDPVTGLGVVDDFADFLAALS